MAKRKLSTFYLHFALQNVRKKAFLLVKSKKQIKQKQ